MRTMENENLRVQISDHGAELSSIYDKAADREAVWIGDPAFWNRHAPVLFPFVGKVNGGFYTHEGVKYPMGQHGFARAAEHTLVKGGDQRRALAARCHVAAAEVGRHGDAGALGQ